eukprot:6015014-Prymnesium_polylepis.2
MATPTPATPKQCCELSPEAPCGVQSRPEPNRHRLYICCQSGCVCAISDSPPTSVEGVNSPRAFCAVRWRWSVTLDCGHRNSM